MAKLTGVRGANSYRKRYNIDDDTPIDMVDLDILCCLYDGNVSYDSRTDKLQLTEQGKLYMSTPVGAA